MATSLIDYIFRELAISYLGRNDLAHVQPADILPDTVGKGSAESILRDGDGMPDAVTAAAQRVVSTGYVRNKLTVLQGGAANGLATGLAGGGTDITSSLVVASLAEQLQASTAIGVTMDRRIDRIRAARLKGYEGDSCSDCGNFTLVRNGTCLKCDTCGSTSGCS